MTMMPLHAVEFGLDVALHQGHALLARARRFGLLSNQASVDGQFRHAAERLAARFPGQLQALFGPQHGLWSTEQDNMIETAHRRHPRLPAMVHSLYSETRQPSQAMLAGLDLFVIDLQDVGVRVYTYIWTVANCLAACAQAGIPVLVLDRPNPLGGLCAEGHCLDLTYKSFVGMAPIPMRHGLTIGELALLCNSWLALGAELHVLPMRGWQRGMLWPATGRAWVPPSPNLPRVESALVYPGQVLLEGTNLSEGRGTTTPFEVCGAPYVDPWQWQDALRDCALPGLALRTIHFEPTFQKWHGQPCGGLFLHVTDAQALRSYHSTLALLRTAHELWPRDFAWRQPPYEYEAEKLPIDILAGSSRVREFVTGQCPWDELATLAAAPAAWWPSVQQFLLY